ncbi:MAG: BcpO-related WXXGXW repeat protein [Kofleriaceae bacterium]|nr:BcpO-related WXXGXW repeat protein [Kofleriaceae bacterium]
MTKFRGLSLAVLLGLSGVAAAQPQVRDHRAAPAVAFPTEAPPAPKEEKFVPRRGQVWVAGQWDWKGGKWVWKAGHFEGRKKGKRFNMGKWDHKGDHWEWVAATWVDAPKEPFEPPAPIAENPQPRRGFVWVKGYWQWNDGDFDWVKGHFERRQSNKQWQDGHWDNAGGRWTWTAGAWIDGPKEQPAPPAPLPETRKFGRGQVWVAGHWEWDKGAYEWVPGKLQKRQKGKRWSEGKWDNAGGKWTWTVGMWSDAPREQDAPPPAIAETAPAAKKGFVWVKGNYEYRDGDYEWVPGHWERERANKRWADGHWDNVGGKWTWTAGSWQ